MSRPQRFCIVMGVGRQDIPEHGHHGVENRADVRDGICPREQLRFVRPSLVRSDALLDNFAELLVQGPEPRHEQTSDALSRTPQLNRVELRRRVEDGRVDGVAQSAVFEIRAVEQDRHQFGVEAPNVVEILERRRILRRDIVRPLR